MASNDLDSNNSPFPELLAEAQDSSAAPAGRGNAAKRWIFVLNNPTDAECAAIRDGAEMHTSPFSYILFGREHAPGTGTPHLQGYFELVRKQRLSALKCFLGFRRAHFRIARGSSQSNLDYASKEDPSPYVFGTPAVSPQDAGGQATRKVYDTALECARNGDLDGVPSSILIRHYSTIQTIARESAWKKRAECVVVPDLELRPWQERVLDILAEPPSDRQIYFVLDVVGGAGKSTFAKYLRFRRPRDDSGRELVVQVLHPCRSQDMARIIQPDADVFILDMPRSSGEHAPWSMLEMIKNGDLFSSKYECEHKVFPIPHVFVFCNSMPPDGTFSEDRVAFIDLN